ncbi:hypothetical protein KHQ81_12715 [Mycoplasmatota bacterium]|nr:hypothetical protein KHQ81_12715 [Mycoplasmatota bacterium]
MKSIVSQFFFHIVSRNQAQLNRLLDENCIYTNLSKSILGRQKVINYINNLRNTYNINRISILNCVKDSKDTLLVSYHVITGKETMPVYGSAVIQINEKKIGYIKNYIVK